MGEKYKRKSSVFDRLNPVTFEHFKPLSNYSLFSECEQNAGLPQTGALPHPFVNCKIEFRNNCQKKRKCDDADPCYGYETPAKRVFSPSALSPDLGCVMDFNTPTSTQDSVSPLAAPTFCLLEGSQTVSADFIEASISSELQSQQVKLSVELANIQETYPHGLGHGDAPSDPAPDFDCDVEDILCLNLAGAPSAVRLSEHVESCEPSEHTLKPNPENPSAALRQKLEEGRWKVDGKQLKETGKDDEEDKGYFSASYVKDLESGQNLPSSGDYKTSSPKMGLCGSVHSPAELLEGDVEEAWSIGRPIFESSLCQKISGKLDPDDEGNQMEPIHKCGPEETTLESSYENSLPWVKVKSVVIVPSQPSKPSSCSDPNRGFQPVRSTRPVIFKTKAELEHEKQLYVRSVKQHMNERALTDPVAELRNLMTHVAAQVTGPCGVQWKHPSDVTQRNYKKRFGNVNPKMRLAVWQAKNRTTHKRFSKIPKNL